MIWIVVILVLLRQRRQRQQLERAKLMVLAHQGDLLFGDPEPMQKGDEFAGGEIDPETGELRLFRAGGNGQEASELAGMPSIWSGLRNNPMFGDLGEDTPAEGYIDGDELEEDSLGDLSDFDDADFEVCARILLIALLARPLSPDTAPLPPTHRTVPVAQAFADSLLDNTGDFDDKLFGSGADGVPQTVRLKAPAARPRLNLEADESDVSESELSDLSDFENDLGMGNARASYDGSHRDSLTTLDGMEVHVVQPSYADVGVEIQAGHVGSSVSHAQAATHFNRDDILDV